MITFVDTNVLLDVFLPDPKWGETSKNFLDQAYVQGSLIINEIIY
jgi:predicted nucleic acid-binding protein